MKTTKLDDITAARDELLRVANALTAVIEAKSTLTEVGAIMHTSQSALHRNLAATFEPYIKRNITKLDIEDLCETLRTTRSPADRLMLEIFATDCDQKDKIPMLPDYDEEVLWTVAAEVLTHRQLEVIKLLTGITTGQPETLANTAAILGIARENVSQKKQQALFRLRKIHVIKRIVPNDKLYLVNMTRHTLAETQRIVDDYNAAKLAYEEALPLKEATEAYRNGIKPLENGLDKIPVTAPITVLISETDMSVRAKNCLHRANIDTLNQIAEMPLKDIKRIRNSGKGTQKDYYFALRKYLGIDRPELLEN